MISKNPRRKPEDEVCEVDETQTTYMKWALEMGAILSYKLIPTVETDNLA